MNSKVRLLLFLVLSLLLAALLTRNGDLAWLALPFLIYLGVGVWQAPSPQAVRLQAVRTVCRADVESGAEIDVQATIHNQGERLERLLLYDVIPEEASGAQGVIRRCLALGAGEQTTLHYSWPEKRGSYAWEDVRAVASDPFGLIETRLALPAPAEIQIQPEHRLLRRFPLRPHGTLHSPGSIPARLGGSGTDFWGVREYHPGDALRWLYWRQTARHPGQLFTKEFEQEEIADIGLILDARQHTELRAGDDSLFERSVSAAASLAEAFLHQGHRVSLAALNNNLVTLFPAYGKVQLQRILSCLAALKVGTGALPSLEITPLKMFSSHALLVVLSPLSRNDWPFFQRLRARRFQGLLISPDPFDLIPRSPEQDRAGQLARRVARLERRLLLREIAQIQVAVIDWHTGQPLYPLVSQALRRMDMEQARK